MRMYREHDKQHRAKRKSEATDRGRDATRLTRLSLEQLEYLYNEVLDRTENGGNVDLSDPLTCLDITAQLQKNGYPRHVQIGWQQLQGEWDNKEISQYQFFVPSQIMLACNGFAAKLPSDEASHLCDNPACVRVEHLVWENHAQNDARKNCKGSIRCLECTSLVLVCDHSPRCIKITQK